MNNRMREPFHMLMHRASTGYNDSWSQVDPEVLEKFAEAIIKECNKVIHDGTNSSIFYQHQILRHFGVNE
jgi:hypothetical protein